MNSKSRIQIIHFLLLINFIIVSNSFSNEKQPIVFTTQVVAPIQLGPVYILVESLRTFGGNLKDAPVLIYVTKDVMKSKSNILKALKSMNTEIFISSIPTEASEFPLADWVYTAARIEKECESKAHIVAFIGTDTVILQEPEEYILQENMAFGYRPVFHRNINPHFSQPLDAFWKRAYDLMKINESDVFPMITPADGDTIRPYFQAGCLVFRPEKHLMRMWLENFELLYLDTEINSLCIEDPVKRRFTFQVALTGAVLNTLDQSEMIEFSERINYPIFFKEMFGAKRDFHDITNAATIRYEHFFGDPPDGWEKQLIGPTNRIDWLKSRFDPDEV